MAYHGRVRGCAARTRSKAADPRRNCERAFRKESHPPSRVARRPSSVSTRYRYYDAVDVDARANRSRANYRISLGERSRSRVYIFSIPLFAAAAPSASTCQVDPTTRPSGHARIVVGGKARTTTSPSRCAARALTYAIMIESSLALSLARAASAVGLSRRNLHIILT